MPTHDLLLLILIFFAAISTSIISAIAGMGGGVTLLSILSFIFEYSVLIPLHGITQMSSNISRAYLLRTHIRKDMLLYFILGAPLGIATSVFLIGQIKDKDLPFAFIVILILYTIFKPKKLPALKIPIAFFSVLGFVSGILGILVGATGPFLAPFFLRDDLNKKQIIATKASLQIVTHTLKIPGFIILGFSYLQYWPEIITLIVGAYLGTRLGIKLLNHISEKIFILIYKSILLLAAIRLIYKILSKLSI